MNARNLAAAITLAGGFVQGRKRIADEDAERKERDEDRKVQREERQLRLADAQQQRTQNAAVAEAGKPVAVQEVGGIDLAPGEMGPSQTPPSLASFKVGGNSFLDRSQADTAAAAENTPEAQTGRVAAAYRTNGAPEKALTLENAAFTQKREKEKYTQEQIEKAKQFEAEGLINGAKALRAGDVRGIVSSFNAGGQYKLDGDPVLTQEDRDIPGVGKIPTFTAKLRLLGPDGKVQERSVNSHDLSMQLLPYEKTLEFMAKGSKDAADTTYKAGMLGAAQKTADAAMTRAQRAGGGGEGGGAARAPSGWRWTADGTRQEPIPGGPFDKTSNSSKPLSGSVLKQLQEVRDASTTIGNLNDAFKDNYAGKGVLGMGAEAQIGASANLGVDKDSVDWWKNYRKTAELVQRHAMFGASLTTGEQEAWRSADIGPGMNKDVIKRNLQTRAELARKVLENARQDFVDAGHSEDRVNAIASRGANGGGPKAASQPPSKTPAPPKVGTVQSGYQFLGGDPSNKSNWKAMP